MRSAAAGRYQTCIHLSGGGQMMLPGCGATSLTALKAQRPLRQPCVPHPGRPVHRRTAPLLVTGPPGTSDRLAQAMETLFPGSSRADIGRSVAVTGAGLVHLDDELRQG
jgi:hypothetical protein